MFADQRLREVESAQAALVSQGEGLRREVQASAYVIAQRISAASALASHLPRAKPLLLAGAAAAGFLAFRNFRAVLRWTPRLFSAWRFARQILERSRR